KRAERGDRPNAGRRPGLVAGEKRQFADCAVAGRDARDRQFAALVVVAVADELARQQQVDVIGLAAFAQEYGTSRDGLDPTGLRELRNLSGATRAEQSPAAQGG